MRAASLGMIALGLLVIGSVGRVSAQPVAHRARVPVPPIARRERVLVSVNAGVETSSLSFDTSTLRMVYLESAVLDTSYRYRHGLVVDGSVGYRVGRGFGVGVAMSSFSQPNDVRVNASIPGPTFFQAPRSISGTVPSARRDTLAAHLQAFYAFRPARRVDVAIAAGPSFFRLRQTIVDDVSYRDTYPYDAPTFIAASTRQLSGRKVGFSASADVAVRLSRHYGVGVIVRASKADVHLTVPTGTTVADSNAGGVHAGGGLRLFF